MRRRDLSRLRAAAERRARRADAASVSARRDIDFARAWLEAFLDAIERRAFRPKPRELPEPTSAEANLRDHLVESLDVRRVELVVTATILRDTGCENDLTRAALDGGERS